ETDKESVSIPEKRTINFNRYVDFSFSFTPGCQVGLYSIDETCQLKSELIQSCYDLMCLADVHKMIDAAVFCAI
ncbi:hypothetical protein, partial [Morganella morganii]